MVGTIEFEDYSGIFNVKDYGAVGDGVTDDTAAIQAAFDAGNLVYLCPNAVYKITSPITKPSECVVIGNNATILTDGDFDMVGSIDIAIPLDVDGDSVTSIDTVNTSNLSASVGDSNTYVTRIGVADASLYARGDIVKVYSQDQIPQSGSSNDEYLGEFAEVIEVDNSSDYIYLGSVLYYTSSYSTSVKISKFSKEAVKIENLNFEKSASQPSTANTRGIVIRNAVSPIVNNIIFTDCDDDGVSYYGCYGASTYNVKGVGLKTASANSATGYLVFDVSSSYGVHTNLRGNGVRNVYNSDTKTIGTLASMPATFFGESVGNIISNSSGITFGLHAGTRNITFENIHTETSWRTPDSGSVRGFTNRGVNNRLVNSTIKAGSVKCYNEAGATVGASLEIINSSIDSSPLISQDLTLRTYALKVEGESGVPAKVTIRGGYIRGIYSTAIDLDYAEFESYNAHLHYARNVSSGSSSNMFTIDNSSAKNYHPIYDTTDHLGTASLRLFDINDANSSFESYWGTWIGADGGTASAVDAGTLSNEDATARVMFLRTDATIDNGVIFAGGGATIEEQYFAPNTVISTV